MKRKKSKNNKQWWFLVAAIIVCVSVWGINPRTFVPFLTFFTSILKKIIPALVIVFVLMVLVNLFVDSKQLTKSFGKKSGLKGWILAIAGGIISMGPPFLWYPLLNDLQKSGVRKRYIAIFLYNRAVKPALLPFLILYFGLTYTIVLTGVMIFISIFQGIIVEKITEAR